MNSTSIVQYRPLVEVIDFHGNRYYSEVSYEDMVYMRTKLELIDFSFSRECVKTSHIVKHRIADPEDVTIAWETQKLTSNQKRIFEASKKCFFDTFGGSKPLSDTLILSFVELAKKNEVAKLGR